MSIAVLNADFVVCQLGSQLGTITTQVGIADSFSGIQVTDSPT